MNLKHGLVPAVAVICYKFNQENMSEDIPVIYIQGCH